MTHLSRGSKLTALALVLAGCLTDGRAAGDKPEKATKANYDKLKKNMAEKEVLALLGEPTATANKEVPVFGKVKEATWKGAGEILVLFGGGKLVHKQANFGAPKPKAGKEKGGKANKITLENLRKIKNDMPEQKVIDILGKPTEVTEQKGGAEDRAKSMRWEGGGNTIWIAFEKGKVFATKGNFPKAKGGKGDKAPETKTP